MGRSAAVLLLTLVLGAFVAANAGDYEPNDWTYEMEPKENKCGLGKPRRYSTWGCPTCAKNPTCITTTCSKDDGKADVDIDLTCLFGGQIGFAAVSYNDVCVSNKKGETHIYLSGLECKELKKKVELRFIVQDKWWYNPEGKELDSGDVCYSSCTHGKPCHTCEFKFKDTHLYIPRCNMDDCKQQPKCDEQKPMCPPKIDDCFKYDRYKNYVKVTFDKDCHEKRMKHVACSYNDYRKGKMTMHHRYSDEDRYFWFNAVCGSEINWYFEDGYYRNPDAPICAWDRDDCYQQYFKGGKVCDQCGRYKVKLPDCKKDDDNNDKPKKGGKHD